MRSNVIFAGLKQVRRAVHTVRAKLSVVVHPMSVAPLPMRPGYCSLARHLCTRHLVRHTWLQCGGTNTGPDMPHKSESGEALEHAGPSECHTGRQVSPEYLNKRMQNDQPQGRIEQHVTAPGQPCIATRCASPKARKNPVTHAERKLAHTSNQDKINMGREQHPEGRKPVGAFLEQDEASCEEASDQAQESSTEEAARQGGHS